jgi:hypothetical protein
MPHALAEAISLEAGEAVCSEVLDREELHLVRSRPPTPRATRSPPQTLRGSSTKPKVNS